MKNNCEYKECLNLEIDIYGNNNCKVQNLENPEDEVCNIDCKYFKQSQTCRRCVHRELKFYYNEPYGFEEEYGCELDESAYVSYISILQGEDDFQCKNGRFEFDRLSQWW